MPEDRAAGDSIGRRLVWFVGLWIAGVATLAIIGVLIRTALAP